jgi:hypothetical protein
MRTNRSALVRAPAANNPRGTFTSQCSGRSSRSGFRYWRSRFPAPTHSMKWRLWPLYMVAGSAGADAGPPDEAGGRIGVLAGPDGLFLVHRHPSDQLSFECANDRRICAQHRGEVRQRPAQTVDLVYHHAIHLTRFNRAEPPGQSGPTHVGAGKGTVVIEFGQRDPAFAPLSQDEGFGSFALRVERVEFPIKTFFNRFLRVDRAAEARRGSGTSRCRSLRSLPAGASDAKPKEFEAVPPCARDRKRNGACIKRLPEKPSSSSSCSSCILPYQKPSLNPN